MVRLQVGICMINLNKICCLLNAGVWRFRKLPTADTSRGRSSVQGFIQSQINVHHAFSRLQ